MSYSEELCEKSLHLIFEDGVKIIRNYRPDWLKNPDSGKYLEMDFYLPHIPLAIEIQGQHHYDDLDQIERDKLKRNILESRGISFVELSIFQIKPHLLRKKILSYSHLSQYQARLKSYNPKWQELTYVKRYKQKIRGLYGNSKCCFSPHINKILEKNKALNDVLDRDIMLTTEFNYKMKCGMVRVTPLEITSPIKVKCRILGSEKVIFVKKKNLIPLSKIIS